MKFEKEFFEDEYRESFLVERMMKCYWAAQIEVLEEIERVCEKYGLTYYADSGTLLGAVRHKGFIPWDDDVDITMKRADYEKFLAVAEEELPSQYRVFTYNTTQFQCERSTRIVNNSVIELSKEHLNKFHGCPFVAGIDLYPLDYIPVKQQEAEIQVKLLKVMWNLIRRIREGEIKETVEETLREIGEVCRVELVNDDTVITQLLRLIDAVAKLFCEEEAEEITIINCMVMPGRSKYRYRKEWFDSVERLQFENGTIAVPAGYEQILRVAYGDDYMMPKITRLGHEYPLYQPQLQVVEEWRKKNVAKELPQLIEDIMSGKDKRQIVFRI